MEVNVKPAPDTVAVVADDSGMVFSTRKEWQPLPESAWKDLDKYDIKKVFRGSNCLYFLLRCMIPLGYPDNFEKDYLLVKIVRNQADDLIMFFMHLSTAEGHQVAQHKMTLLDS